MPLRRQIDWSPYDTCCLGSTAPPTQRRTERVDARRPIKRVCRGKIYGRINRPRHDQRQSKLPPPLRLVRQKLAKPDFARHGQRHRNVSVQTRAISKPSVAGPSVRFFSLSAVAVTFPQQNGGAGASVRHNRDVHVELELNRTRHDDYLHNVQSNRLRAELSGLRTAGG